MNKHSLKRICRRLSYSMVSVVLVALLFWPASVRADEPARDNSASATSSGSYARYSYADYLKAHEDAPTPAAALDIEGAAYSRASGDVTTLAQYDKDTGTSVRTGEKSSISWEFDVAAEGFYQLGMDYYPIDGKGGLIERELLIDGKLPFDTARSITFGRVWVNASAPQKDKNDNEYRPGQIEKKSWLSMTVSGYSGYIAESYRFYFSAGRHQITLNAVSEPLAIRKIRLFHEQIPESYAEYIDRQPEQLPATGPDPIEAEAVLEKSDATLYAINDRSSPDTTPGSISKIRLNTIGGGNWSTPGQWLKWELVAPESGLYQIAFRAKQNYNEGSYSCRKLYIDDVIPFAEAENVTFTYDTRWQMKLPGGEDEPYQFYLEKGRHTITLEVTLGNIAPVLQQLDEAVFELNYIYRKIRMITGMYPDPNRDYRLELELPECIEIFERNAAALSRIKQQLQQITGGKGADYASVEKLEIMISDFVKKPDNIPERMEKLRANISENAAWVLIAGEQPLLLDKIYVQPAEAALPRADAGFFEKLAYGFQAFVNSFFEDYSSVSTGDSTGEESKTVTLWMGNAISSVGGAVTFTVGNAGRDQAQVLKTLVDNYFTPEKNINVNIRLIDTSALLPAVAAGKGPDVAIGQDRTTPVNYALRKALRDLSEFPDLPDRLKQYRPSAYEAFKIGNSVYALPETETFPMMFYRGDVLEEMNIKVPETWSELHDAISLLQRSYLEVGLPSLENNDLTAFYTLIAQMGGQIYNDDHSRTALSLPIAINAFTEWSEFYTKYKVPQKLDMLTRFRTGEAPIVITTYSFYNSLAIAAPEIKGLWDFTMVPGIKKEDGAIDRSVVSDSTGAVIFANAKDKDASWEFLKWWTGEQAQASFGRELEYLQGPAARWPTANLAAAGQLSWDTATLEGINRQRATAVGIPEVPGGYITNRYVGNAIRLVINNGGNPREMLLDWDVKINDEISFKRKEFGME